MATHPLKDTKRNFLKSSFFKSVRSPISLFIYFKDNVGECVKPVTRDATSWVRQVSWKIVSCVRHLSIFVVLSWLESIKVPILKQKQEQH